MSLNIPGVDLVRMISKADYSRNQIAGVFGLPFCFIGRILRLLLGDFF